MLDATRIFPGRTTAESARWRLDNHRRRTSRLHQRSRPSSSRSPRECHRSRTAYIINSPRAAVYFWSVLGGLGRLGMLEEAEAAGVRKQDYTYLVRRTG